MNFEMPFKQPFRLRTTDSTIHVGVGWWLLALLISPSLCLGMAVMLVIVVMPGSPDEGEDETPTRSFGP